MDKIYVVGQHGPESNEVCYICTTYEKALVRFHELRKERINEINDMLKRNDELFKETGEEILKNLLE